MQVDGSVSSFAEARDPRKARERERESDWGNVTRDFAGSILLMHVQT